LLFSPVAPEVVCFAAPHERMNNEFAQDDNYITKKEMAARMNVTPRTIDSWMQKGLIPYRKLGRTVRFAWGEVSAHFASQQRGAQSPTSAALPGPGIAAMLRERAKTIRSAESERVNISNADRSA
jgi:excisionase family DNA binding protein